MKADQVVAVVGLGYVGLPLAVEFGKKVRTIGFDLSAAKIENYKKHIDPTGEVSTEQLQASRLLEVTTDPAMLAQAWLGQASPRNEAPATRLLRDRPTARLAWANGSLPRRDF